MIKLDQQNEVLQQKREKVEKEIMQERNKHQLTVD